MKATNQSLGCAVLAMTWALGGCDKGSETEPTKNGTTAEVSTKPAKAGGDKSQDGPFANTTWVGSAEGWTLTIEINEDFGLLGLRTFKSIVKSNRPDCLLPGELLMKIRPGESEITGTAVTRGDISESTTMAVRLTPTDRQMVGKITILAHHKELAKTEALKKVCDVYDQEFTFRRQ